MDQSLTLPTDALSSLSVKTLFYPCAGTDWQSVVQLFVPEITRFWFVDICYRKSRWNGGLAQQPAGLTAIGDPEIIEVECEDSLGDPKYRGQTPFIRRQKVRHGQPGVPIEINWYMRRGPSALHSLKESIGIFLYRGDSNEGGSGTEWLVATRRRGQFRNVLERLVNGGLIVTDGSNPGLSSSNPYAAFSQFISKRIPPRDAATKAATFSDTLGNQFSCVGYVECPLDSYKGPVLIWQRSLRAVPV